MFTALMVLSLLCFLLFFVGLIWPRTVINDANPTRGRVIKTYGGGGIFALILATFFAGAPSKNDEEASQAVSAAPVVPKEASAFDVKEDVVSARKDTLVTPSADNLEARLKVLDKHLKVDFVVKQSDEKVRIGLAYEPDEVRSDSSFVKNLANLTMLSGREALRGGVDVAGLAVRGMYPVLNQDGSKRSTKALVLSIPEADIAEIRKEDLDYWRVLEVSDAYAKAVGQEAARAFCGEGANAKRSPLFCSSVTSGQKKEAMSVRNGALKKSDSTRTESNLVSPSSESTEGARKAHAKMLGLDFKTFKKRVNDDFSAAKLPYMISAAVKPEGKVANIQFSKHLSTVVSVDPKTGAVGSITSIIDVNGDLLGDTTAAILAASAAAGKDGEKIVGGDMLRMANRVFQEFIKSGASQGEAKDFFVRDGVKYSVLASRALGIWISADPMEDK